MTILRTLFSLILLAALAAVLALSNPTSEQYQAWLGKHIAQNAEANGTVPILGKVLGQVGSALSSLVTERENFGVFSVYITHDPTEADRCTHVVGIAAHLFPADTLLGTTCPKPAPASQN